MEYTVNELHELFDTLDLIEELSQEYEYFDNNQLNHRADVLRFANLMVHATNSLNHLKLFGFYIQTTLFFGKKSKNICFIMMKAVK